MSNSFSVLRMVSLVVVLPTFFPLSPLVAQTLERKQRRFGVTARMEEMTLGGGARTTRGSETGDEASKAREYGGGLGPRVTSVSGTPRGTHSRDTSGRQRGRALCDRATELAAAVS